MRVMGCSDNSGMLDFVDRHGTLELAPCVVRSGKLDLVDRRGTLEPCVFQGML